MSEKVQTGITLTPLRFWTWLQSHANCILRAGTPDTWLFDHADLHWQLMEDADRMPLVQLMWGKQILGELAIDLRDVLFVQGVPDPDPENPESFRFELMGGAEDDVFALYHFLVSHPFDEPVGVETVVQ